MVRTTAKHPKFPTIAVGFPETKKWVEQTGQKTKGTKNQPARRDHFLERWGNHHE